MSCDTLFVSRGSNEYYPQIKSDFFITHRPINVLVQCWSPKRKRWDGITKKKSQDIKHNKTTLKVPYRNHIKYLSFFVLFTFPSIFPDSDIVCKTLGYILSSFLWKKGKLNLKIGIKSVKSLNSGTGKLPSSGIWCGIAPPRTFPRPSNGAFYSFQKTGFLLLKCSNVELDGKIVWAVKNVAPCYIRINHTQQERLADLKTPVLVHNWKIKQFTITKHS